MEKIEFAGLVYEFEDGAFLANLLDEHAARVYENAGVDAPLHNAPLTLEELRELKTEWVWIKFLEPVYRMESGYYQKAPQFSDADTFCIGYSKPSLVVGNLPYSGYGYIWLAYRRRPEEA